MGTIELVVAGSLRSPRLEELAVLRELQDARVRAAVPFGDEDIAVRCDEHVVRLIEEAGRGRTAARAKRHQELPVRTELEHLVALRRTGGRTEQRVRRR